MARTPTSRSSSRPAPTINATYLGSNDEIFANLRAGGLGEIDIVTPYHGYVKNLFEAGFLQEIDYSRLPNTADYIPLFQKPDWNTFDGKTYSAPFVWGTGPMIYNAEFIPEAPEGVDGRHAAGVHGQGGHDRRRARPLPDLEPGHRRQGPDPGHAGRTRQDDRTPDRDQDEAGARVLAEHGRHGRHHGPR